MVAPEHGTLARGAPRPSALLNSLKHHGSTYSSQCTSKYILPEAARAVKSQQARPRLRKAPRNLERQRVVEHHLRRQGVQRSARLGPEFDVFLNKTKKQEL